MIFILILYLILCFYGAKFHIQGNKQYLSKSQTSSIKGIFILLVFFSHFNSYVSFDNSWDYIYYNFVYQFGQTMVTMFLFYSGYGVMESLSRKTAYVDTIPKKRVLSTLIRFDCAVFLFLIIGLFTESKYDVKQVLLSFIGWEAVGNSNWYIFVILLLYMITYIAFKFIKTEKQLYPVLAIAIMVMLYIGVCHYYSIKPWHWYDTALCYVLGILWSIYKEKIELTINKNIGIWGVVLLSLVIAFLMFRKLNSTVAGLLVNILFTVVVVVITMRISIGNQLLQKAGDYLFELYILQRIPMILLKYVGIHEYNVYLYFIGCLAITLLLIKPFRYCCDKVVSLLIVRR